MVSRIRSTMVPTQSLLRGCPLTNSSDSPGAQCDYSVSRSSVVAGHDTVAVFVEAWGR